MPVSWISAKRDASWQMVAAIPTSSPAPMPRRIRRRPTSPDRRQASAPSTDANATEATRVASRLMPDRMYATSAVPLARNSDPTRR
jgi:hypothetical protein